MTLENSLFYDSCCQAQVLVISRWTLSLTSQDLFQISKRPGPRACSYNCLRPTTIKLFRVDQHWNLFIYELNSHLTTSPPHTKPYQTIPNLEEVGRDRRRYESVGGGMSKRQEEVRESMKRWWSPRVWRSKGLKVPASQGPRYLKVKIKRQNKASSRVLNIASQLS